MKLDFSNINAEIVYNAFQIDGKEDEALNDVYLDLYELIGKDAMLKLFTHFHGDKIDFPMRLYRPEFIADLLGDHAELSFPVSDGLDLGIDLGDNAHSAHPLQVGRIGEFQVGDGVTVDHPAVFVPLAGLVDVQNLGNGTVALSMEGEAEAFGIHGAGFLAQLFPVNILGADGVGAVVGLLQVAAQLADGAVSHLVIAGETDKFAPELVPHGLAVFQVGIGSHRLTHEVHTQRQITGSFQIYQYVSEAIEAVEAHFLHGGDAPAKNAATFATIFVLRKKEGYNPSCRLPGGLIMPSIAIFMTCTLIWGELTYAPIPSLICAALAIGTGLPVYFFWENQNKKAAAK